MHCAGSFSSMEAALEAIPNLLVDVALVDIGLPGGMEGSRGTNSLKKQWPRLKVLILSNNESEIKILEAFAWGADGYLIKAAAPREVLADSVRQAYDGDVPMSKQVRKAMRNFQHKRGRLVPHLTITESTILEMFNRGLSDKDIGDDLGTSVNTVKEHIRRIVKKALVSSRHEANYVHSQTFL